VGVSGTTAAKRTLAKTPPPLAKEIIMFYLNILDLYTTLLDIEEAAPKKTSIPTNATSFANAFLFALNKKKFPMRLAILNAYSGTNIKSISPHMWAYTGFGK
jgi:hypothetical protein